MRMGKLLTASHKKCVMNGMEFQHMVAIFRSKLVISHLLSLHLICSLCLIMAVQKFLHNSSFFLPLMHYFSLLLSCNGNNFP